MALFDASLSQQRLNASGSRSGLGLQDRLDLPNGALPGGGGELLAGGHVRILPGESSHFKAKE
jgi:hypothetical protein